MKIELACLPNNISTFDKINLRLVVAFIYTLQYVYMIFSLYRTYCTAQRTQCYQGKCEKHNNTNNCSSETEKKSPKESRTPKQKQQLYQHRPQIAGKVSAISALGRWPRYRGLSPQRGGCERQNKTTWRKQTKTHKKSKKTKKQIKTHDIF